MPRFTVIFLIAFAFQNTAQAQDTVYIVDDPVNAAVADWQPYPGLGTNGGTDCVHPSDFYGNAYTGLPQARSAATLNSTAFDGPVTGAENANDSIFSTPRSGDLYLSRVTNGKRTGAFQKLNATALWVPESGGRDGLGMTQLDLAATFALPLPTPKSPFIITPSYEATFFQPKTAGTVSSKTFHTTGADFRWMLSVIENKLTVDLGASVLYSGDYKIRGEEAMRYPAHLAAIWNVNPRVKFIVGVVYLDRNDDYNWLPMAGVVWTPHDDVSVELVAPRLRIARRIRWFGSAAGEDKSDWLYGAFELAGGSWGHEMRGVPGHVDYRDLRAVLGYERRCASGVTIGFEVGYMFERRVEFDRLNYRFDPSDNVFLRLRTSF